MKIYINLLEACSQTCRMAFSSLFIGLILSLMLCELSSAGARNDHRNRLKQHTGLKVCRTGAGFSTEASSVKCKFQGTARRPTFTMEGDFVIGGVFSIRHYKRTVNHNYTTMPEALPCAGRLVKGRICKSVLYNDI